jgi:hypothetical protein
MLCVFPNVICIISKLAGMYHGGVTQPIKMPRTCMAYELFAGGEAYLTYLVYVICK